MMERVTYGLRRESQCVVETERKQISEDGSGVAFVSRNASRSRQPALMVKGQ